ncbi:hypothetical protein BON30_40420 [Cystobacter ferrugineus]|uniref:Uncharacterized protein n=1 Tax=Cystobacter ferrugineus TaxID=83449 RepID=A0A1L9AXX3_9BACT|nr:hypothetical protein BON30_40420 [Cystobacter ferrugineus]
MSSGLVQLFDETERSFGAEKLADVVPALLGQCVAFVVIDDCMMDCSGTLPDRTQIALNRVIHARSDVRMIVREVESEAHHVSREKFPFHARRGFGGKPPANERSAAMTDAWIRRVHSSRESRPFGDTIATGQRLVSFWWPLS